jgi:uncharacterized integral membrane protein
VSFVKLVLWVVVLCVVLFFAALNLSEVVEIRLWWGEAQTYENVPLVVGLGVAYLLGMVTYFLMALTRDIRFRGQIGRLRRENRALQAELHHLRGASLDDLPIDEAEQTKTEEEQSP